MKKKNSLISNLLMEVILKLEPLILKLKQKIMEVYAFQQIFIELIK